MHFGQSGAGGGFGFGGGRIGKKEPFVFIRGYGSAFGDDAEVMRAHEKDLQACFAPAASHEKFNVDVDMTVDEHRAVTEAHVGKGKDHLSDQEAACATRWARSLAFSCETVGGDPARLQTMLAVSR